MNKESPKYISFKSGVFSILTSAHVRCLEFCKQYSDRLIVLINDDNYQIRKKGFILVPENERKRVLLGLSCVDEVHIYSGENEDDIVKELAQKYPNDITTMFHSAYTHNRQFIPGEKWVDRIMFCPDYESSSTSDIINRILES